jgi:hypothetical protein
MTKQEMPDLIRRQNAVSASWNKFKGKPVDWAAGHTCVHLARFHLRAMGHTLPKVPRMRSLLGAKRALAAKGWADVRAMLAGFLPEIAPLAMLPGDLITTDSEDGMGCIMIFCGPNKLAGWHQDAEGLAIIDFEMDALTGAFRG